jgi:two-component system, autoinducer 2 sensor kinase/phosphatase LuxQ
VTVNYTPPAFSFNDWPDGLISIEATGLIAGLNKAASKLIGWSDDEAKGRSAHGLLCQHSIYTKHADEACPLCQFSEEILAPQESYWTHKNSENVAVSYRRTYSEDGNILIIFTTCEQQGYQVGELKKLSLFTEINPAPLLELDKQGLILFSNPVMTDLMLEFGFNDEGAPAILPDDLPSLVGEALELDGLDSVESSASAEDDTDKVCYFLWSFHIDGEGQGKSILVSGLDVSSRKEVQLQQEIFNRTLEQEKERTRKEYLAMMVHELRSPLNAVVGYAGILKKKLASHCSDAQLSLFDRIIEGGNQLAEQISTTLDSTRVEAAKLVASIERFDAIPVLEDVCIQGRTVSEQKGLAFKASLPGGQMQVLADKQHFKQVAVNLISNAIKYTPEGTVAVSITSGVDTQVGNCIVLEVKDTGCGIPADQKESIFKLYERQDVHESGDIEGDGYGLAICLEMLELNYGRILLDSEEGVGSTFSAIFPT